MAETLILYKPQHDYPEYDLTPENAQIIPHYVDVSAINAEARHESYEYIHKQLYRTAQSALELLDGWSVDTGRTLDAFNQGVATFNVIAMTVNSHHNRGIETVRQNWRRYVHSVDSADSLLSDRLKEWPELFPQTYGAVIEIGEMQHQSLEEIRYRTIGAQVAYELHTRTEFL